MRGYAVRKEHTTNWNELKIRFEKQIQCSEYPYLIDIYQTTLTRINEIIKENNATKKKKTN